MRILLQRHGESEGNIDERAYINIGDQNIGLTPTGWQQGINGGKFLRSIYQNWPLIYFSPYERTRQMLSATLHGIGGATPGSPIIYEEPRLMERYLGARNILEYPEGHMDQDLASEFRKIVGKVLQKDPFVARNLFGESNKEHMLSVKSFIDGTFMRDLNEGHNDVLIVAHGATIQTFLMIWAHIPMSRRPDMPKIKNGDIIAIEGEKKNWSFRKIFNGPTGTATNINILDGIRPIDICDLPPVPANILQYS